LEWFDTGVFAVRSRADRQVHLESRKLTGTAVDDDPELLSGRGTEVGFLCDLEAQEVAGIGGCRFVENPFGRFQRLLRGEVDVLRQPGLGQSGHQRSCSLERPGAIGRAGMREDPVEQAVEAEQALASLRVKSRIGTSGIP
jgi:hypothetical protein